MELAVSIASVLIAFASLWLSFAADRRSRIAEKEAAAAAEKAENYKKVALQIQEEIADHQKAVVRVLRAKEQREREQSLTPVITATVFDSSIVVIVNESEVDAFDVQIELFGGEVPKHFDQFPLPRLRPGQSVEIEYVNFLESSPHFGGLVTWKREDGKGFETQYEIRLG